MTALQNLNALADQRKATKHPSFPAKYTPLSKYNDRDANGLTRCIVDYLNLSGYFSTRLASTGTYRTDLQRFVSSQQKAGLPDVFGVVEGHAVFVEVKVGKDRLSDVQKQTITQLKQAGAWVYVADNFQGFYDWFKAEFLTSPF
ncbi:VRR-NUC domain-containing protein [Larkinella terrae]|uniref:VRR-NUC domain-containing protein n=1 Tax=Larkinella terrae TaxID=2025311 RepID=A0A7K0EP89_9BACT|nr:VRR-NUC domain-containing protein [Larkinella terrae]MRS63371.1 VRR-NUC domain-containing protein [Larkinella terrae]